MAVKRSSLARDLAKLPTGLDVVHNPARVYARPAPGLSSWSYSWSFETTVRVTGPRPLTVEKFGLAALRAGRWAYSTTVFCGSRRPKYALFTPAVFARAFQCSCAVLEPGKPYTDANSWVGSSQRKACRLRWLFVACDGEGRRFKGTGEVELLDWMML